MYAPRASTGELTSLDITQAEKSLSSQRLKYTSLEALIRCILVGLYEVISTPKASPKAIGPSCEPHRIRIIRIFEL
jgi:hypothetical protein